MSKKRKEKKKKIIIKVQRQETPADVCILTHKKKTASMLSTASSSPSSSSSSFILSHKHENTFSPSLPVSPHLILSVHIMVFMVIIQKENSKSSPTGSNILSISSSLTLRMLVCAHLGFWSLSMSTAK